MEEIGITNGMLEGVWRPSFGTTVPSEYPYYSCPFCNGDSHCFGVKHSHNFHNYCKECGAKLIYPDES